MTRSYIKHGVIGDEEDISPDYSVPVSTSWNSRSYRGVISFDPCICFQFSRTLNNKCNKWLILAFTLNCYYVYVL